MFEMLTKNLRSRSIADEGMAFPLAKECVTAEYNHTQMVANFKKKSLYNGKSLIQYAFKVLSLFAKEKEISQGAFFISDTRNGKPVLKFLTGFASPDPNNIADILELGEGLPGQVAKDGRLINISDIPQGYLLIESGLGKAAPASLIIFPVKYQDKVLGVIELASFHKFTREDEIFFSEISESIAEQIHKLIATLN